MYLVNNGTMRAGGGGGGPVALEELAALAVKAQLVTPIMAATAATSITYLTASFVVHKANTQTYWRYSGINVYGNNYGHGPWGTTHDHRVTDIKEKATVVSGGGQHHNNVNPHNPLRLLLPIRRAQQLTGYNYIMVVVAAPAAVAAAVA